MNCLFYNHIETDYLKSVDSKLSFYIDKIGKIERKVNQDFFQALTYNVINQQISMKAADNVWNRLCTKASPNADGIISLGVGEIKSCGMSLRKAENIYKIAEKIKNGLLNVSLFDTMSDNEIITELCKLDGVGIWTAEMLMLFSFGRKNIFSINDYGIRYGLSIVHGMDINNKKSMKEYKKLYSPYGSVASLYMWEISAKGAEN